jgi:hypothetical protein
MDQDEARKLLKGGPDGVAEWNRRRESGEGIPDLSEAILKRANLGGANLGGADLSEADLSEADLSEADLSGTDLSGANLSDAYLRGADLRRANLRGAHLIEADLSGANLIEANLRGANLVGADLRGADLGRANLSDAYLRGANLLEAICWSAVFANVDLSETQGLDSIRHLMPSTIGADTLFLSKGKIPEAFLRGCGVHDELIEYLPALLGSMSPIQFYSCFISYSHKDEEFAKRLHSKMRDQGMRVWYGPDDIQGGEKLHEQIDEAIRVHDKLLLVLSPHSIDSRWVREEIRRARKSEVREGRRKLFPIRLMDYEGLAQWESFYADLGEDLAQEIREYFIPDFSMWETDEQFEAAFARLLRDLQASDKGK